MSGASPATRYRSLVTREVALARRVIRGGRFQRSMALLAAFSSVVSGYEAYSQHLRGAFSQRLMWTPLWLTAPTVAAAAALFSRSAARALLLPVSLVLADGIVGFAFHLRGGRPNARRLQARLVQRGHGPSYLRSPC